MAKAPPVIVAKVVALKPHTAFGKSYDTGDAYDLDEAVVDSVLAQGMVRRATAAPAKAAKPAARPAQKVTKKAAPKPAKKR